MIKRMNKKKNSSKVNCGRGVIWRALVKTMFEFPTKKNEQSNKNEKCWKSHNLGLMLDVLIATWPKHPYHAQFSPVISLMAFVISHCILCCDWLENKGKFIGDVVHVFLLCERECRIDSFEVLNWWNGWEWNLSLIVRAFLHYHCLYLCNWAFSRWAWS